MTAARIKAIRFFLKATPYEFALHTGISMNDIVVMEAGLLKPSETQKKAFEALEYNLSLHGITTEQINEKEDLYK